MKNTDHKIAVIIPCYNEEITIAKVITDFREALPNADIVVCDNNSSDNTYNVAKNNGAIVLSENKQGKANAVLKLFEKVDADIYIMVDGDDTYPANQVGKLIDTLVENDIDMVVGDRLSNESYFKENKRAFHSHGNRLVKYIINRLFKSNQKDILSGYRIFSKRFVKNYVTLVEGFELETDLTIFSLNYNLPLQEVPIDYSDRPENSFSKLNTFTDGIKVLKTIFNLFRLYNPLSFFTLVSLFILLFAVLIGIPPVLEYIQFKYVYKVPSLIVSGVMVLICIMLIVAGLILDSLMKVDRKSVMLKIRETK